jgi:hypothetical protein
LCYRDFHHWEKSYQHMCSETIFFHMCWYRVLINQWFPAIFFWIWAKCLYNKQNNTWTFGDMNLSSCVQARYLTRLLSSLVRYRAWTLEEFLRLLYIRLSTIIYTGTCELLVDWLLLSGKPETLTLLLTLLSRKKKRL